MTAFALYKCISNKSIFFININNIFKQLNRLNSSSRMSSSNRREPKKYFINKLQDLDEKSSTNTRLNIDIKSKILELSSKIWTNASNASKSEDPNDSNIYVGNVGISYMFFYLSLQDFFDQNQRNDFLRKSLSLISKSIESQPKGDRITRQAYLLGNAGNYLVASLVFNASNDTINRDKCLDNYRKLADNCKPISYLPKGSDELLVGRAGYVCGALILNKSFGTSVIDTETLHILGNSIINSGLEYSKRNRSVCPLMYSYYDTEYIGAAHGLAGILLALISIPGFMEKNPKFESIVKLSIDYILSLQTVEGNFATALDELGRNARPIEEELVHWCHGCPGLVFLMAKAYLIWKEDKYLNSCLKCGECVWKRGLLRKGPGICHGVAGNGYVFLILYRLTNDLRHVYRAQRFAQFLFSDEFKRARIPDNPFSLYEGLSGTVCYLVDVLKPETASFPLYFDVI